jgi:hypothetical protein
MLTMWISKKKKNMKIMANMRELYLMTYVDDFGRNILDQGCSVKRFNLLWDVFGDDIPTDFMQYSIEELEIMKEEKS